MTMKQMVTPSENMSDAKMFSPGKLTTSELDSLALDTSGAMKCGVPTGCVLSSVAPIGTKRESSKSHILKQVLPDVCSETKMLDALMSL